MKVSVMEQAGADGKSNQCPQSNDASGYCLGFGSGWNRVSNAQDTLNEVQKSDNDGNREDDGELYQELLVTVIKEPSVTTTKR